MTVRTLIRADVNAGAVRFVGEVDDSRGYGEERGSSVSTSEINALEPLQAYAALDLGRVIGRGYQGVLRAGRFTMEIGSNRLIARPDDANSPPAFTGVQLDLHTPGRHRLIAFWTMPDIRRPFDEEGLRNNRIRLDRATDDVQLFGAHYTRSELMPGISGEAYAVRLNERDSVGYPTRNRRLWTGGLRLLRAPAANRFDFDLEAMLQTGTARRTSATSDTVDRDVSAHFLHVELGYRLSAAWSPRISAHFDWASGDDSKMSGYGRFDPLYGGRRAEFGPISLYGPLTRTNLVSPGVRVELKPGARTDACLFGRLLWLSSPTDSFALTGVRDPFGRSGRFAGGQVEGRVRHWLVPDRLRLEAGGAWLAKGGFLKHAPNAPAGNDTLYGYSAMTVSF